MEIIAQCPRCGSNWRLDGGSSDRRVRCKKCRKLFKIPKLDEVPKAVKVIRRAKGGVYADKDGETYG